MLNKFSALLISCAIAGAALASPTVEMQTNQGKIVIELNSEKAPISVANFLQYAKDGFYNGTIFHRTIDGFMIQGGGFTADMQQKPTKAPIENEAKNGLKNSRGSIAMARTNNPQSATAQFFINQQNNLALDYPSGDGWGYAVFGKVTQGMDIVDKIAKSPSGTRGPFENVPQETVRIESVKIIPEKK